VRIAASSKGDGKNALAALRLVVLLVQDLAA